MLKPNTKYRVTLGESILGNEKGFALLKYFGKPSDSIFGINYEAEYKVNIEKKNEDGEKITVIHEPQVILEGEK